MNKVTKGNLEELYISKNKPMHEVASILNISVGSVYNYIHKYGIQPRAAHNGFKGKKHSEEAKAKMSANTKGKYVSKETREKLSVSKKKGGIGHKKKTADGYIKVYFPDHPNSTEDGYILEHILVMEALLGRHLNKDECVHHKNAIKDDNRKENLQLMTKSEHMSFHMKERWSEKRRSDLSIRQF